MTDRERRFRPKGSSDPPVKPPTGSDTRPQYTPPPQWSAFYTFDPTRLNRVVPPLYVLTVVGLSLSVQEPLLLVAISIVVTIANVGLAVWAQRYGQAVTTFQRTEAVRAILNAFVDGILIVLYVEEAPVWCLALTGALVFSSIWKGRSALKFYGLHLAALTGAMLVAGQPFGPTAVMVAVYCLCAGLTLSFMEELRQTIEERSASSALALSLRKEQYGRDMAGHRRKVLASTNQLASSLAHEVNNPLFAVTGNLNFAQELIQGDSVDLPSTAAELREALEDASSAATTISQIIEQMRCLNQSKTQSQGVISDLNHVVDEAIRQIEPRLSSSVRLERDLNSTPPICAHAAQINQIVFNLVLNANDAMDHSRSSDKVIRVSTSSDDVGRPLITVRDTGKGIPAESLVRIFTPFYTTRPGTGSGLGLMVVHSIVEDTGGRIDVESTVGEGSKFLVRFPVVAPEDLVEPPPSLAVARRPLVGRRRLLIVDDDHGVVRMLSRSLRDHDIVACHSTAEADQVLAEDDSFDLILSDIVMPNESGIHWRKRITQTRADLAERIVFLSGGSLDVAMRDEVDASGCPLLIKPIDIQALLDVIADMTEPAEQRL